MDSGGFGILNFIYTGGSLANHGTGGLEINVPTCLSRTPSETPSLFNQSFGPFVHKLFMPISEAVRRSNRKLTDTNLSCTTRYEFLDALLSTEKCIMTSCRIRSASALFPPLLVGGGR